MQRVSATARTQRAPATHGAIKSAKSSGPYRSGCSVPSATAATTLSSAGGAPPAAAPMLGRPRRSSRAVTVRANVNWDGFRTPSVVPVGTKLGIGAPAGESQVLQFDFLVVGSGIAGLSYALKVAEYGRVAVITKDYADEGCTQYAQGGVCAVLDAMDSVHNHVRDTLVAGAFLNDAQAVKAVCQEGPARVMELAQMGADFTRNQDGSLHLTREGGHSHRRIVHAADLTGAEIERALLAAARAHRAISFFEHHLAVELVVDEAGGAPHCFGVDVLDQRASRMSRFLGLSTLLASGGVGQVYPSTTNPHVSTGDGIAMAYRAGAAVSNMEFVQFHPTALYSPLNRGSEARTFLISEAVRGEGGLLTNLGGERFMERYDKERMELAPRDIVARAIQAEMLGRDEPHVWLDISHKPKHEVLDHFPNIAKRCAAQGIDITQEPIPVLPAQHYTCGGVVSGLLGETSIQGLYACGEVSCSGLHGANRLASNSLLEGLVFAERAVNPSVAHAEYALSQCGSQLHNAAASADFRGARRAVAALGAKTAGWAARTRAALRESMWRGAGIVRSVKGLTTLRGELAAAAVEVEAVASAVGVHTQLVELRNLVTCAELIVDCALQRRESRGGHWITDFPNTDPKQCFPSLVTVPLRTRGGAGTWSGAVGFTAEAPAAAGGSGAGGPSSLLAPGPGGRVARSASRDLSVRATFAEKKPLKGPKKKKTQGE